MNIHVELKCMSREGSSNSVNKFPTRIVIQRQLQALKKNILREENHCAARKSFRRIAKGSRRALTGLKSHCDASRRSAATLLSIPNLSPFTTLSFETISLLMTSIYCCQVWEKRKREFMISILMATALSQIIIELIKTNTFL